MTHLFYYSTAVYRSFVLLLDEAEQCIRDGGTPVFLTCDGSLSSYCFANVAGNPNLCRCCRFLRKEGMKALSRPVQQWFVSDWLQAADVHRIRQISFNYQTVDDLYAISYKNVDIGYAALSHFICVTRNFRPTVTRDFRKVIDGFLRTAIFLTDAVERLLQLHSIQEVSLYNGRTFDTRPVLRQSVAAGIPTHVFELIGCGERVAKVCFENSLPQNIEMQGRWIQNQWKQAVAANEPEAIAIGHSFFQKRRSGVWAGDRVYTAKQQKDRLPTHWDASKRNVVFFGSSEDEFVAIDKEWETGKYVPTQLAGVRKILDALSDRSDRYQVYVRVHPNLAGVTFSYHTDLYMLERDYPNVTVLPPDSPVNSYALIDHATTVVVFGSTIGIEAVYWGKPVVLIGPAYYRNLNACHIPRDDAELKRLITSDLPTMSQLPAIMYGYSILGDVGIPFRHFNYSMFWPDRYLRYLIWNQNARSYVLRKTLGTVQFMLGAIQRAFFRSSSRFLKNTAL